MSTPSPLSLMMEHVRHRELMAQVPDVAADDLENIRKKEDRVNDRRFLFVSIVPVGLFWSLLYAMILGFRVFLTMHVPNSFHP